MTHQSSYRDDAAARDAQVLGALEAELGLAGPAPEPRQQPAEDARLAELARIVGQNDRFRELLRSPALAAPPPEPVPQWDGGVAGAAGSGPAPQAGPAQAAGHGFAARPEAPLAATGHAARGGGHDGGHDGGHVAGHVSAHGAAWDAGHGAAWEAPAGAGPELDPDPLVALEGARLRRRRPSRRPLYAAAAVVALCVAGSAGWYAMSGPGGVAEGDAPTIHADAQPVKVRPPAENAAEPLSTKEIYEQLAGPPANTRVVANNEQPVDVEQTLRQQRAAAIAAGRLPSEAGEVATFGGGVAPLPVAGGNRDPREGLGEPRRVRTVSIGPDGKVRESQPSGAAAAPATPAAKSQSAPVRAAQAQPQGHAPQAAAKIAERAPQGGFDSTTTGSVGRADAVAARPAPKAQAGRGGFAVQLGAPGSEEEARKLAASLKRRFTVLSGYATAVVRAESNGRTVYRLRVPGLSREDAVNLCQQLKSLGGSCFVAQG